MNIDKNIETNTNFNSPLGVRGSLSIFIQHTMHTSEGKKMLEVNTEISPRELLCLFGHSGAGKTTILRILAKENKPATATTKRGLYVSGLCAVSEYEH